jgi:hypothetical protein
MEPMKYICSKCFREKFNSKETFSFSKVVLKNFFNSQSPAVGSSHLGVFLSLYSELSQPPETDVEGKEVFLRDSFITPEKCKVSGQE